LDLQSGFEPQRSCVRILISVISIKQTIGFTKKISLPRLGGLTLYDLVAMYIKGIIEGAFTYRAGSIAFSFFMALFPFALFILNLIPYIPIDNFQDDF